MILLDTNVISEWVKPAPDPHQREPFFWQQRGSSVVGSRGAVSHVDD